MKTAVVVTVLNETGTITRLLEALSHQSRAPDEILVVDGGSVDDTVVQARKYKNRLEALQILEAPGTNISQGRNLGIAAARSPLIAVTDADCVPHPDWLAHLVAPLEEISAPGLVNGRVVPTGSNHLEACIGRCSVAFALRLGKESFFPTARTLAFHKNLWERLGGFPEDMAFGEDAAFIVNAAKSGARLHANPEALVAWRPRRSYRAVVRQFYHYAEGLARGGWSGRFHGRTMALSAGGLGALLLGVWSGHWLPWAVLLLLGGAYLWRKARQNCFDLPGLRTYYRVPLVLLAIHVGTMAGILSGNGRRLLRR